MHLLDLYLRFWVDWIKEERLWVRLRNPVHATWGHFIVHFYTAIWRRIQDRFLYLHFKMVDQENLSIFNCPVFSLFIQKIWYQFSIQNVIQKQYGHWCWFLWYTNNSVHFLYILNTKQSITDMGSYHHQTYISKLQSIPMWEYRD